MTSDSSLTPLNFLGNAFNSAMGTLNIGDNNRVQTAGDSPISAVPLEILYGIFSHIPGYRDRAYFSLTSRIFRDAANAYRQDHQAEYNRAMAPSIIRKKSKQNAGALVEALAQRPLTPREAEAADARVSQYENAEEQSKAAAATLRAKKAQEQFYQAFKKDCAELNVYPDDVDNYAFCAVHAITGLREAVGSVNAGQQRLKLPTAERYFDQRVFKDMVESFANQPIEAITIDSVKQQATSIARYFPDIYIKDIKDYMQKQIGHAHGQAFAQLANEFLDPSEHNPRVAAISEQLKVKLEAEQKALEAEFELLRQGDGNDAILAIADQLIKVRTHLQPQNLAISAREEAMKIGNFYRGLGS